MKLRLGTRGSDLARAQSSSTARALEQAGFETEIVIISTAGDRSTAPSFGAIGPQGVFVREIEQALVDKRIDLAVHSFKDLPTQSPDELIVAAVPLRVDAADHLLVRPAAFTSDVDAFFPLAAGSRIGTASARRRVWIEHFRPDLQVESLRGNVPTRISRLATGDYDAILLAGAGIGRLKAGSDLLAPLLAGIQIIALDPGRFVPAPAQGALALQCRRDDEAVRAALATLDEPLSHASVAVERAVLASAEGGCDSAFGAYCRPTRVGFELDVMADIAGLVRTARTQAASVDGLAADAWEKISTQAEANS